MPTRRDFLFVLGALAAPLAAFGQARACRIGFLAAGSASTRFYDGFRQGMRELGYVEPANCVLEQRFANGNYERLPGLAADLVRARVDAIVAGAPPSVHAAHKATATIPIVLVAVPDPVGEGFAASLSRPGGNITGLSTIVTDVSTKHLELLRAAVPKLALARRLPSIFANREMTEAGGLMSYGQDLVEHYRRAATYVDKILKGAKAGELPIEQPTLLEFVINRRTAKALGLAIPKELLLRADRVID